MAKTTIGGGRPFISRLRASLWKTILDFNTQLYRTMYKMDIGEGTRISYRAYLDKTINPRGIHIGSYTEITGGCSILTHDAWRQLKGNIWIGDNCFIGIRTIILPNVRIGNGCIIGAGSVVTKDIPDNCVAAGNPARIIKSGISCSHYGRLCK